MCAERDPKGLYAKVNKGQVASFTGKDSSFEEPQNADLVLDTEMYSLDHCVDQLKSMILSKVTIK